jgi:hypothetical protein
MWLWENADKVGNLSQGLLTIIAVITVFLAYLQVTSSRRSQRESTAMEAYRNYLLLSFQHPGYATPDEGNKKIIANYKYRWFVAVLLNACDEILDCVPNDVDWKRIIAAELEYHTPYLKSPYFLRPDEDRGWTLYSEELERVFKDRHGLLKPHNKS